MSLSFVLPSRGVPCRARGGRAVAVAVAALSTVALAVAGPLPAATAAPRPARLLSLGSARAITVTWRGNGHGHGMSQYGARGAARAGLSYRQIVAFYYPHTTLVRRAEPTIRVLLADFGSAVTVAPSPGLHVTGYRGTLPTSGVSRYRLVADTGSGLTLQQLRSGGHWATYRTHLPNRAQFSRSAGYAVREYAPNGTSNTYRGAVRAVRATASGAGAVNSVNVLGLERYVAGVAPREMPASWERAAVDTQAIAARTYAQYALDHPRSSEYDICDTTACQFYGGNAYLSRTGAVVWHDDTTGADDTHGLVATYDGRAIFAQFSASNGGWTVDGGQPYLVARSDPYDTASSGDPYLAETNTVSTAALARRFGLSRITGIAMAGDGNGTWGGRATSGYLYGLKGSSPAKVAVTGWDLADALGAWTNWYTLTVH